MTRIFDTTMGNDELDLLECRIVELERIPNLIHVVVEADVDHQDHPKPFHFSDNYDRFAQWKDRICFLRATGLPTAKDAPDPWAREHAQREHTGRALVSLGAANDDIVLHGDLDEIPTALAARNVKPRGMVAFEQRLYCFAVDWYHPQTWKGTVAARASQVQSFGYMRDCRNIAPSIPNAGWHLSWLGGQAQALKKLGSFCHPEIADRTHERLTEDWFLREGWHVDGTKLVPVDVDRTWPKWIRDGNCPENWFRPR